MQSIWSSTENFLPREPLKGDLTTDAAVIGGGMAGILTAYFLKQHGVEPVVLEAKTVGSGQTRNTTAKITSQHGLIYHKLLETLGVETARAYAEANQRAIQEYERIIREHKINCCFETKAGVSLFSGGVGAIAAGIQSRRPFGNRSEVHN